MNKLLRNNYGFSAIELLLVVVFVLLIGFAAYEAYSMSHSHATSSLIPRTTSSPFPTGHIAYTVPTGWKTTLEPKESSSGGFDSTRQTSDWGYAEYAVAIDGPTKVAQKQGEICGIACDGPDTLTDYEIQISDYGTNGFTSAEQWYTAAENKTFTDPSNSDYSYVFTANQGTTATFAGQSAYCVPLEPASTTPLPSILPKDLLMGGCYVLWHDRIYLVQVQDDTINAQSIPSAVTKDRSQLTTFLENVKFD